MVRTARRDESDQVSGKLNQMLSEFWKWHANDYYPSESWTPAVNVYRLAGRLEMCVDLAGMPPKSVELQLEPGRLVIRGHRAAPDPRVTTESMRIHTMEINHGPFCRSIALPPDVHPAGLQSEYRDGMLWIRLPLRPPG